MGSPMSYSGVCSYRAVFRALFAAFFSTRTPLNFLPAFLALPGFLTATNSPDDLSRLVQAEAPPIVVFVCERFFTAPLRALSPVGLLTAVLPPLSRSPLWGALAGQAVPNTGTNRGTST